MADEHRPMESVEFGRGEEANLDVSEDFRRDAMHRIGERDTQTEDIAARVVTEHPRHGFPRRADHLRDLFVRQVDAGPDVARVGGASALLGPFDEEPRQLLARTLRETESAELALRIVVVRAELLDGVTSHARRAVEKPQKCRAGDKTDESYDGVQAPLIQPINSVHSRRSTLVLQREAHVSLAAFLRGVTVAPTS